MNPLTTYQNELVENAILCKLFYNKELRDKYLLEILPNIFFKGIHRLIVYAMQELTKNNVEVTYSNILIFLQQKTMSLSSFMNKNSITITPSVDDVSKVLYNQDIDSQSKYFKFGFDMLYNLAFKRFVEYHIFGMKDALEYSKFREVVGRSRAIQKTYDIMFNRSESKEEISQLEATISMINTPDEYISTSSPNLNKIIGGFSRRCIVSIIAKSGHNKTTWSLFNALSSLKSKYANSILYLPIEEDATYCWRRIYAMVCGIGTSDMRSKSVVMNESHTKMVQDTLLGRLKIMPNIFKYSDIVDILHSYSDDVIYIDHLQSITYPGRGTFLANMIGGIPGLLATEKQTTKTFNNCVVNLSQVSDKEIQGDSSRKSKAPRYYDAYASSAMYQGSREFLSFWYPIRDFEDNPASFFPTEIPNITDVRISVEKSNFTKLGKAKLKYNPELCIFEDKEDKKEYKKDKPASTNVDDSKSSSLDLSSSSDWLTLLSESEIKQKGINF